MGSPHWRRTDPEQRATACKRSFRPRFQACCFSSDTPSRNHQKAVTCWFWPTRSCHAESPVARPGSRREAAPDAFAGVGRRPGPHHHCSNPPEAALRDLLARHDPPQTARASAGAVGGAVGGPCYSDHAGPHGLALAEVVVDGGAAGWRPVRRTVPGGVPRPAARRASWWCTVQPPGRAPRPGAEALRGAAAAGTATAATVARARAAAVTRRFMPGLTGGTVMGHARTTGALVLRAPNTALRSPVLEG